MSEIARFFSTLDAVALGVKRGWLRSSSARVPAGTFAHDAREGAADGRLLRAGDPLFPDGADRVWVFREGPWPMALELAGLPSPDGLEISLQLELAVEIQPSPTSVRQFLAGRSWPDRVHSGEVAERVRGALQESFGLRLAQEPIEGLVSLEPRRARALLEEAGEEVFFERGMTVRGVSSLKLAMPEARELVDRQLELKLEEERVRQRLRFIDLWKRQEMGERLARRDVEALQRHLREEGILRDLEHSSLAAARRREEERRDREADQQLRHLLDVRELEHEMEIDSRKLEEEIERTRRLNEVLRDGGIEAQLFHLKDEALKGRLYRLLLERDLTPEQLRARSAGLTAEDLGELQGTLRQLVESVKTLVERSGDPPGHREVPSGAGRPGARGELGILPTGAPASRILIVAGETLHVLGAGGSADGGPAPSRISLGGAGLGSLRSVRSARCGDATWWLVGAREGVYAIDAASIPVATAGGSEAVAPERLEVYRLAPPDERPRGGANSALIIGERLFATHSEKGLVRWRRGAGEFPEVIDTPAGSPPTARGAQLGPTGALWYSRGEEIVEVDPSAPERRGRTLRAGEEVSSFAVASRAVLAGTRGGRILRWGLDRDAPPELLARPRDRTIYMVRSVPIEGRDYFTVGTGLEEIVGGPVTGGCAVLLRAPSAVCWAAACGRYLYGVDRRGRGLYVWDRRVPAPPRSIQFAEKIRDLWIEPRSGGEEVKRDTMG